MNKKIGIVGLGRLGSALARNFHQAGLQLTGLHDKNPSCFSYLAQELNCQPYPSLAELASASEIIFLTVPDALINIVAEEITRKSRDKETFLIHCSGALNANALPPGKNILRASFHPLRSFATGEEDLAGLYIALDGDPEAVKICRRICLLLQANVLQIPAEERALYHAGAVFVSNYLTTLLGIGEEIFARWATDKQAARAAIMPLITGTVSNFAKLGAAKALTGPISRGDEQTIQKHINNLPAELVPLYKYLGKETLKLAEKNQNFPKIKYEQIKSILKGENQCR